MKTTLVALGLALGLASCAGDGKPGAAESTATPAAASAEAGAATALADSLARLPGANPADVAAGRAYAQSVAAWYASGLSPALKTHPLAEGIWKNYRYVLRQVAASRGQKKVKPEDASTWDGFTPQCAEVAKLALVLTQDSPPPNSDKAVPQLQMAWDGMANVAHAAERHSMYLAHPETRDR